MPRRSEKPERLMPRKDRPGSTAAAVLEDFEVPAGAEASRSGRRHFLHYGLGGLCAAAVGSCLAGRALAQEQENSPTKKTLWISASNAPPYTTPTKDGFEDRLIREVFRRLDIDVRIYDVPSERGLTQLNEGHDDGTLARNPGMSARYPNMVQFSEKALDREYLAYTKRTDLKVNGWNSLAGYKIGIVKGWKILEQNITSAGELISLRDGAQLFRVLDENRIDLAVFNRWGGLYLLRELGIKDVRALEPPLARREVFFYLHQRHADLAVRASEILREIKQDGTYQGLVDEILTPLMS